MWGFEKDGNKTASKNRNYSGFVITVEIKTIQLRSIIQNTYTFQLSSIIWMIIKIMA